MADSNSIREGGHSTVIIYRAYKRRWAIMLAILLLAICNVGLQLNMAAVAYKAADYFKVTLPQITWFGQIYLIVPPPLIVVSTYIFNKFDMKVGIHIGAAVTCAGAVTRAVATSGLIREISAQYAISIVGQVLSAMGQLFIPFAFTKVTQNWFPDRERILATTLMAFFPPLGISLAQVMAPLIVTAQEQIPTLNYVYGGLAVFSELVTIVCVTRARPPTPPSRSAEQGTTAKASFLQQLKSTFTCLPFLGLLMSNGVFSAYFVNTINMSQQILCSVGYSDLFSGIVVSMFNIAGFLGSILVAMMANRTKALTPINKAANGLGVVFAIFMMEIYLIPGQPALLIISSFLYGFCAIGVYPLTLEMGVETTYPVEETISNTLIYVSAQLLGAVMTYTTTALARNLPPRLQQVEVCTKGITSDLQARDYSGVLTGYMGVLALAAVLFILFFRTPYKRMEAERSKATGDTSSFHTDSNSKSRSSSNSTSSRTSKRDSNSDSSTTSSSNQ